MPTPSNWAALRDESGENKEPAEENRQWTTQEPKAPPIQWREEANGTPVSGLHSMADKASNRRAQSTDAYGYRK
jgi:hypothetical protein